MKKNFAAVRERLRRLVLTVAVGGCALAGGGLRAAEVTLDIPVFAGGYGTAFYEETARRFEAVRPGVKISLYGDPRVADKVRVRVMDGHLPDAVLTSNLLWPVLIRAGKVRDLTTALAGPNWEGDARWGDTFVPGATEAWRVDGGIYGLPFAYACWTIFYDKELFRAHGWEVPRTWEEFFVLCEKIRATGLAPFSLPGTRWLYADAFLRAASHNLLGDAAWRTLGEPAAVGARLDPRYLRAAEILQRITQRETVKGWEGESHTGAQQAFLAGRAAMTVSGSWFVNEMRGKLPPGFELGAMNFPVFADGAAEASTIQTGSDCFFVLATGDPERERLTVDFLRYLTSRARAEAFVRSTDAPVAVRGVPAAAYSPLMQDTVAMIAQARAAFNVPQEMLQPPALRQALVDASQLLTGGKITPREFGERLEAAAAADRARAAEPDRVDVKHGWAAAGLLLGLSAVAGWLGWERLGKLKGRTGRVPARRAGSQPVGAGDEGEAGAETGAANAGAEFLGPLRGSFALGFVGPAFALYAALVLLPGVAALAGAFTRWDGLGEGGWAGLFNFKWLLLESDTFWHALGNNLWLMLVPALLVVPVALLFAALIHRGVWGADIFRAVLLFPNLLGGIAATLLWMNAYTPHGGLVNATLIKLGLGGFADFAWLAPDHLYLALIPIYLWMACGFNLVLYLAAMQGVPAELYEAAELDGMPAWRQFFSITLPLIREVIVVSAVFLLIGGLNAFELVWLLTSQNPTTATHTLGTMMVTAMFQEMQMGRATAIAAVMFGLVLLGSAAVMRACRREPVEM